MTTLWDVVTSNSSLPVQAGNTFWDHINNQKTPLVQRVTTANVPPPIVYGEILAFIEEDTHVVYDNSVQVRVNDPNTVNTDVDISAEITDKHTIIG